jgi:hypothetical protein
MAITRFSETAWQQPSFRSAVEDLQRSRGNVCLEIKEPRLTPLSQKLEYSWMLQVQRTIPRSLQNSLRYLLECDIRSELESKP